MAARPRLDYVDWLRILAVALLLPFHTARVFDVFEANYVKNDSVSPALSYVVSFLNIWQMPLLFVLAGMATSLALGWRSGGQYLRERVRRLVVPFVFGLLVIVPPQSYLALVTHAGYTGTYADFYPSFFNVNLADLTGYYGGFTPAHLWFILYLAVFSVVALPLFLWLRTPAGAARLTRAGAMLQKPGGILYLIVPLAITGLLPDLGGKNPFTDLVLFGYGYALMADESLRLAADRMRAVALAIAVILSVGYCLVDVNGYLAGWHVQRFSALDIGLYLARITAGWCWIVALVAYGRRYMTASGPILGYLREASYPVYILHQTVIILVAYFVVSWDAGVAVKFLAILIAATAGTMLVYELLVRRFDPIRFLFGMKPRSRVARPALRTAS